MKKMKIIMAVLLTIAPAWAGGVSSNLVVEVMPTVTNLVNLPMDEAVAILKEEAKSEWARVETEMSNSLAQASEQLRELQTEKQLGQKYTLNPEQSNIVARIKTEQDRSKEQLRNIRLRLRARIEALEQLKKDAEQQDGGYSPPAARSPKPTP